MPSEDVVVSILSNGQYSAHAATQDAVLRAALEPLPEPTAYSGPTFDPSRLPELAGRFVDPDVAGEIVVTEGGANGLQISIPAFDALGYTVDPDLVPGSTFTWFVTIAGSGRFDLTFVVDARGELTPWLRTRYFVGERADERSRTRSGDTARIAEVMEQLRARGLTVR